MRRRPAGAALGLAGGLALGMTLACVAPSRLPAPRGGVAVEADLALDFHRSATAFYGRLLERRFNTLETFSDPQLRQRFSSQDLFFDYYANLAHALAEAHFQESRPHAIEIEEFLFEDPEHVRVQVRFRGRDGRPLRPDATHVVRRDRWQRSGGVWVVVPEAPGESPADGSSEG